MHFWGSTYLNIKLMNNINGSIFQNQTIKNKTRKKFNLMYSKKSNNSTQNMFLSPIVKNIKYKNKQNNSNNRYKSIDINSDKNSIKKNNYFLTPRYDSTRITVKESTKNSNNTNNNIDNNERCFILNNNLLEYNSIIALLSKILVKSNSYGVLTKIKNYIKKLISQKNYKLTLNNFSFKEYFSSNDSRPLSANKNINKSVKIEINKEEKENKTKSKNDSINKKSEAEKNILLRKIKKLYQRINELEEKYRIEQLKYLFFIIEQEKKIAELEKSFENNQMPIDERIIEKMKELKCLPNYYKPDIEEENIKMNTKKHPLSGKLKNSKNLNNNNSFLKSRNNNNNNIQNKYSFDKDVDPIIKRNISQILNLRKENKKDNYMNNISISKSKRKHFNFDESNEPNEIKKQNSSYYSKPINQLFNGKNFFISHPKLKYLKDSQEKNHFQKLKAKEQLNGFSNLLSNINFGSKFQKIAVNDFSYFLNNSMLDIEKYRDFHNYIKIGNKFEESLKLKRKSSLY